MPRISATRRSSRLVACILLSIVTTGLWDCHKAPPPRVDLPPLEAPHAGAAIIEIDGVLDEWAWMQAAPTGELVHPGNGRFVSSPVNARAYITWDDQSLYVSVIVDDDAPTSPFTRDAVDPHIWAEASGIEVMLQPGDPGDNREYYEIQVDVAGAVWDTHFDDYNSPITGPEGAQRFGHQDWDSQLSRAVVVNPDRGTYTVELALPWAALASQRTSIPPQPGDVWRLNLYSFRDGQSHSLAWSPLMGEGNFHYSARFGRVTFVR